MRPDRPVGEELRSKFLEPVIFGIGTEFASYLRLSERNSIDNLQKD